MQLFDGVHLSYLLFVTILFAFSSGTLAERPNIVLIVADDLGWNDFGFHGQNQIPTPNIDALAYNGVILNRFYTQHTCTPSRAALLTGNYPIRSGFQGTPISAGEDRHLPLDMPLLPEMLKELGYSTHLVGKWHLGAAHSNYTPTKRGFDTHFGYWNGYIGYFDYVSTTEDMSLRGLDLHENFRPTWEYHGKYATEAFTEKALDVIEKHEESRPLFLMVSHLAGHTGINGTELGVPDIDETDKKYHYIENDSRRKLADIVNIMDRGIGQIVRKLRKRNMLHNSVIIFLSDNGAQTIGQFANAASNWPLRGLKFTLHEGGVRGSAVLYSAMLAKKGYINNNLMHITDLMPTLYYLAGGNMSNLENIDGINQWDTISENHRLKRTEVLLNIDEKLGYSGIIGYGGRYKLLNGTYRNGIYDGYHGDSGRELKNPKYDIKAVLESDANCAIHQDNTDSLKPEHIQLTRKTLDLSNCRNEISSNTKLICNELCLFDIFIDPCETQNIIEENEDIAANLKYKLFEFVHEMVPQKNTKIDPLSNPKYFNNTWCTWLDEQYCLTSS